MTTYTYTFTTSKAFDSGGQCPCAIWPDVAPSGATDATDTGSVELGVKFQATQNGTISGIRFYKEPDNTGTHTGTLWTASGTQLATGHVQQRVHPGLGGTGLLQPGVGHGRHHLRGVVSHDHGSLRGHLGRAQLGGDERAADGAGQRRGLRLRLVHHVPD